MERLIAQPATVIIAVANVAIFLLVEANGGSTDTATLVHFGALERGRIWDGEFWRLATAMFLHIGWVHLLWNTVMMFGWCLGAERALGTLRFATVYLLSGIGASATSMLCHDVVAAGASGAGFGVVGVILVLYYVRLGSLRSWWEDKQVRQILVTCAVWFAIGFLALNMDNYAHLGGLAFGAAISFAMLRKSVVPKIAVGLILAATAAAACVPWPGMRARWKDVEAARRTARPPNDAEFYYGRGREFERQGNEESALADYSTAIREDGAHADALFARARLLAKRGDKAGAIADLEAALARAAPGWKHAEDARKLLGELQQN